MDLRQFIQHLLGDLPTGYGLELRRLPGGGKFHTVGELVVPPDLGTSTYHFSVMPRLLRDRSIDIGGLVWLDTDGSPVDPATVYPEPSLVLASGGPNHLHVYWKLEEYVPVEDCVRLSLIAAVAYGGDTAVCEPRRVMRVPGSANAKYNPPVIAEVLRHSPVRYALADLEECLVAAVFREHYVNGQRHELSMHIAALLARAGWDMGRSTSVIRHLYALNPGTDLEGKLAGVRTTYEHRAAGDPVASRLTRELLGDEQYTRLLKGLGITSRDGDLLVGGEVVGTYAHRQKDLAAVMMASGDWGSSEGKLFRWLGTHWHATESETLLSECFKLIGRANTVKKGEEVPMVATASEASAIARVVTGMLLERPLPEPDPHELPLANGVLHVPSGELLPHRREQHHRWLVDITYDPTAACPTWLDFLAEAAPPDCREFLQEWAGYCLLANNPWQRMLWLHGPSGTGKSTFIKVINDLLGPGATAMGVDKLTEYSLAELAGKRVAVCSEMSPRTMRTTMVKALVAGDPIQARHPYGRPFEMEFQGKLVWGSNSMPPLDQAEGMRRRINVVQFSSVPRVVNTFLEHELEAELPGILNWAVAGAQRLVGSRRWDLPPSVAAFVEEYTASADPLRQFFLEEVELVPGHEVPVIEYFQRYVQWAKERQLYVESLGPAFYRAMRAHGLEPKVEPLQVGKRQVRVWVGGRVAPGLFGAGLVDYKVN